MELRYGIESMSASGRRMGLDNWLREQLPQRFEGHVLAIDSVVADRCGILLAHGEAFDRAMGL